MNVIMRDVVRSFLDVHVLVAPAATFTAATSRYPELFGSGRSAIREVRDLA
jgi:hypothetical protein